MLLYALLQMMPAGSRTRWMGRDAHRPLKNNDSARIAPSPKRVSASQCASAFCRPPLGSGKSHTDLYVCVFACVRMCVWNYVCAFGTYVRKCGKVATIRWPTCVLVIVHMGFHSILFFEALDARRLLFPPPVYFPLLSQLCASFACVWVGGWTSG